ncbi:CHAT domain-containing protein [Desulfoluna spongiiphila]|uniref:CHAT domain-containing protein n=1 Tax=Desulfoluna spongiiphila TaxID=419481 RepID=UPI00125A1A4C|nr:CHAT domain-containing protein [Desulfoluna spongiiphila]VVS90948.1 consensus disorder prediction [Desulfoluna spongiiphila]
MPKIRSVKLELLRHGPPHNQLISPLTRYMGLSGRHEPVTVTLPYEQQSILTLLRALRYGEKNTPTRRTQIREISAAMGQLMEKVPGLIADLSLDGEERFIQLRLVFSASELALLPFEMADAARGFPGEGSPLALQQEVPVVLTREIRGADGQALPWNISPRILFAAAAPPGVGTIPFKAHLLALRGAVGPWLPRASAHISPTERLSPFLTILPSATLEQIQTACAEGTYTHVHILAHGVPQPDTSEVRYGLALCDDADPSGMDVVDGERLAAALRVKACGDGFSSPLVVTVASCDSGQQGSVVLPGSSLVHAVHNAGVPLVIGSQYPLTKTGSVTMARTLYAGLLWGKDPRICLYELRQQLRRQDRTTHDWGSLIAYASLPDDMESQLGEFKTIQAHRALTASMNRAHNLTEKQIKGVDGDFDDVIDDIRHAISVMPDCNPEPDASFLAAQENRIAKLCILGSAEKRQAQALYLKHNEDKIPGAPRLPDDALQSLERSLAFYRRAATINAHAHWPGTQVLSLSMFLRFHKTKKMELEAPLWAFVEASARYGLLHPDPSYALWACANLAELHFLALVAGPLRAGDPKPSPERFVTQLVEQAPTNAVQAIALRWQFHRYTHILRFDDTSAAFAAKLTAMLTGPLAQGDAPDEQTSQSGTLARSR